MKNENSSSCLRLLRNEYMPISAIPPVVSVPPIHFCQEYSRNGRPPSSLQMIADIQGNITLSYPNGSIKHISIEQQMKIYEESMN